MHTQTGDLTEVWREIRMIWRIIGRLEATGGALRRENDHMRRDMRDSKAKAGIPLWVHLTAGRDFGFVHPRHSEARDGKGGRLKASLQTGNGIVVLWAATAALASFAVIVVAMS